MKIYGMVLAAVAVVILGAKVLQAGWSGQNHSKTESVSVPATASDSERDLVLRWQQHRANHWRGYMLQQP